MRLPRLVFSALFAGLLVPAGFAVAQPPEGDRGGQQAEQREPRRGDRGPEARQQRGGRFQGGQRGAGGFRPGQVLPPMMVQRLGLSPEQIEQLETLQQEVNTRLQAILTEQQRNQMRQMAERAQSRFGAQDGQGRRLGGGDERGAGRNIGPRRGRGAEGEQRRDREQRREGGPTRERGADAGGSSERPQPEPN